MLSEANRIVEQELGEHKDKELVIVPHISYMRSVPEKVVVYGNEAQSINDAVKGVSACILACRAI